MGNHPVVFPLILALASALNSAFQWSSIPPTVPVWWDFDGNACFWVPKWLGVITLPILELLIPYVICLVASYDSDLQKQAGESKHAVAQLIALPAVFLFFLDNCVLLENAFVSKFYPRFVVTSIALWLLIWLGYNLQYVERNSSIGILTPWTVKNGRVWKWTHEHCGFMLQLSGVILLICSVFVPLGVSLLVVTLCVWLGSYLYLFIYSWVVSDAAGSEVEKTLGKPLIVDQEV